MAHLDLQRGTFAAADTLLGSRSSRKIGHNTYMRRVGADTIAVRYHATDVYTVRRDGWAILNSGGWETVTTASRLNALMPSPWGISWSRGLTYQWRPITPFADGLAVHVESGAVGFAGPNGTPEVLLTAEEVAAIVAEAKAREEARAVKRAERIMREHPAPRPVTYRADVIHSRYGAASFGHGSPLPSLHRSYSAAAECGNCRAEAEEWAAMRRPVLEADHEDAHAWAVTVNGGTISEPAGNCPWDCPKRYGSY